jgi:hypothetical protein
MNEGMLKVDMQWFTEQHAARVNLVNNILGWNENAKYIKPNIFNPDDKVLLAKGIELLAEQLGVNLETKPFNGDFFPVEKSFTMNGIKYFQLCAGEGNDVSEG